LTDLEKLRQQHKQARKRLDELRQTKWNLIKQKRCYQLDQAEFEKQYSQIVASEKKLLTEIYNIDLEIKVAELEQLFQQNKYVTAFWRPLARALPLVQPRGKPFILKRKIRMPCNHEVDLIKHALGLEEPERSFYLDGYLRAFREPFHETYGTIEQEIVCPKCGRKHVLTLELKPLPAGTSE